jgi:hypothetical protein
MILQALTRYYEILEEDGKLPKPGYADAKVSFALNLSEAGKLLEILPLKHEEKRGKKDSRVAADEGRSGTGNAIRRYLGEFSLRQFHLFSWPG